MGALTQYERYIAEAARAYGIPPALLERVILTESGGNATARSPVGAMGLMQLMPSTARGLGVTNPDDPYQNIMGGAKYLAEQKAKFGSWPLALAAYNAGPGAVVKYGGIPPFAETQRYISKVLGGVGLPNAGSAPQGSPTAAAPPAALGGSTPALQRANELAAATIPDQGTTDIFSRLGPISGHIAQMQQEQEAPLAYTPAGMTQQLPPTDAVDHPLSMLGDKGIKLPTSYKPTHDTDGLPGFPAIDVFGAPDTVVRAPATGVIQNIHKIPWNGKTRVGGWTAYLVTPKGTYFLTHMGSIAAKEGQQVQAGQPFATIGAVPHNWWQPHIHQGFQMRGKG